MRLGFDFGGIGQHKGRGNSVAVWTPLLLPSLVAWWDASSLSASPVTSWTDKKSGIVASTVTASPTWSATARNGKPGVSYDGVTQGLGFTPTGFPSGANPGSAFVAGFAINDGGQRSCLAWGDGANGHGNCRDLTMKGGNVFGSIFFGGDITGPSWDSVDHAAQYDCGNGTQALWVDGVASGTPSADVPNTTLTVGALGGAFDSDAVWRGVIQQAVVTSTILNTRERQLLEGWESWIDGKAGANLPGGHPFKSRAPLTTDNDVAQTTAFIARANAVTPLDATHLAAYKALINGGVDDGWFQKLDCLYILAAQARGHSLLNLRSTSFTANNPSAGTFTVDRGFAGAPDFQTNYDPASAGGLFTQNSAHQMVWDSTSGNGDGSCQLALGDGASNNIYARFADGSTYFRTNGGGLGVAAANAHGFYLGNRSASGAWQGYKNGALINSNTDPSSPVAAGMMHAGGIVGVQGASSDLISACGAGGSLTATEVANYYARMLTYMAAVGVPGIP